MHGGGRWLDVCLRNVSLLLAASEAMGIDPEPIYEALPEARGLSHKELSKVWVPLDQFDRALDAWVAAAGHPAHLIECGRSLKDIEFGSEAFKRIVMSGPIQYLTDPGLALSSGEVIRSASKWTTNKRFHALYEGRRRGEELFHIEYLRGPAGEPPRRAGDDLLSVIYWIRGMWEQIAPMWAGQDDPGSVELLRAEVDVFSLVDKVLPGSRRELVDGVFLVDGAAVGRVVWLLPDAEHDGRYLGDWAPVPPEPGTAGGSTPAVRIERDLQTVSTRTRESLALMREGEIYSHPEHPVPGTAMRMRWRSSMVSRWFGNFFRGSQKRLTEEMNSELEQAASHRQVATYAQRLQVADEYLRKRFPTQQIARGVLDGVYEPQKLTTAVLLLDIVKFTVKSWKLQSHEMAAKIRRFSARMIAICEQEAGWFYKFTGDGGIFVWTDWSGEDDAGVQRRAAQGALQAARMMRRIAEEEFGWELRIGLHAGEVTWYILEEGFSFEGTGIGIDLAARMEKAAGDGQICCSQQFVDFLVEPEGLSGPNPVEIKHGERVDSWTA